jgi:anthranilate phosphoribosyltransferase
MSSLSEMTRFLAAGQTLSLTQIESVAGWLTGLDETDTAKEEFLTALSLRGETAQEIAGFAQAFRKRAIDPGVASWASRAIDIVGTGGDHSGGFNVSSLVVLVLASAGVTVMKHGNRGVTSKCGSADLLAGLGVNLAASPEKMRQALDELGFVFFFAPAYHPSFKHIAPIRKTLAARGQRTVFNILGPLINPGRPAHVLLGVFSKEWVPRMAAAFEVLDVGAGLAAHGVIGPSRGIDEVTTATANHVSGFGRLRDVSTEWSAEDFGLPPANFADLEGGDLTTNLAITEAVLAGRGPAGLVDTIALNAAVAMWIVGKIKDIREGIEPARDLLLSGSVRQKIADAKEFYAS